MKKNIRMMLAMMAGVVALTACSDEMLNDNGNPSTGSGQAVYTFTAQTEGDGATSRAVIDGMDIKWQASLTRGINLEGSRATRTLTHNHKRMASIHRKGECPIINHQ